MLITQTCDFLLQRSSSLSTPFPYTLTRSYHEYYLYKTQHKIKVNYNNLYYTYASPSIGDDARLPPVGLSSLRSDVSLPLRAQLCRPDDLHSHYYTLWSAVRFAVAVALFQIAPDVQQQEPHVTLAPRLLEKYCHLQI